MRKLGRREWWAIVDGIAVAVVVSLLVLIGIGYLVLPSPAAAKVTVTGITVQINQGSTSHGTGWFGPSTRNLTVQDGLPTQVGPGQVLALSLILPNMDDVNHTIVSAVVAAPFSLDKTAPTLPAMVVTGNDDWLLVVTVVAPSGSGGGTYSISLTLNAE